MPTHDAKTRRFAGLLTLLGVLALAAGPAQAACTRTWVGGVDSNFGTAGNWSPAMVPGSSDDACITATTTTSPPAVADTYTVILNNSFSVHSLTLGGPNGTQTLVLPSNGSFSIGAASAVTANGALTLGDSGAGYSILAGPGALTNNGHLNTVAGMGDNRYIRTNIINTASGTFNVAGNAPLDQGATITNNGTVTIETGANLLLSGGSFANNAGTVTNNGTLSVSGGTVTQRGTVTGNAVLLSSSTLDDDLAAGNGLFTFAGGDTLTGTGSNPGVPAGQVVTIGSNAQVTLGVTITNAGTIAMGDSGAGYSILAGPGALTNNGHLNTVAGMGDNRYLRVGITNTATATIDLAGNTQQDQATTTTNNGTLTIEAGESLSLSGGSSFAHNGTVTNNGTFTMSGGTFTQRGTVTGNAVLLGSSTLDDDLAAGNGLFTFTGGDTLTGTGSNPGVPAGQVVSIGSNTQVALGVTITNAGTITMGDSGAGYSILAGPGALTNNGHLNTVAGMGDNRYLRVGITNTATATIDLAGNTQQDQATTTTNNGTLTIEAGESLSLSGGSSFADNGTVTNNGTLTMSSGTFRQRGTVTGNAVLLSNSTLDDDLAAGNGLFTFTGGGTLTGTGSNPGVPAGQVVSMGSNTQVTLGVTITNAGTITIGDSGAGYSILAGPGALTNSGHLNTVAGMGDNRYLRVGITNTASGTIDLAGNAVQDQGATTNNGTVKIEAGGTFSLGGGSSFAEGASATFAPTINANTTTFGQLIGGGRPVSLDGKLMVTTVGTPAVGSSWPIISGASRSGQFATFDFGSDNYDVQYTSAGVTLVGLAAPTPTSTPTPTQTLLNTRTATPTSTPTTPPTSTATSANTPTPTVTRAPSLTATVTPVPTNTASFTPTASRTHTPTATPTSTATAVSTGTLTPTLTATGSPTKTSTLPPTATPTHTPTPTPILASPTVTATATNTPAMVVLAGTVLSPGRGGTPGNHDEVPLAGVEVDLFLCALRQPCLGMGTPVASVVTDGAGGFRIPISRDLLQGILPLVAARISPTLVFRAPVLVLPAAATSFARQVADGSETVVDAISEAAVRVLEGPGFENFGVEGIGAVVQAVEAANATTSFADLTAEQGVDLAQTTAVADPTVQMALHDNQFTPTPTPLSGICVGDCGGTHTVAVNNVITLVNIALGTAQPSACPDGIPSGVDVNVAVIIQAVNNALNGCS